MGNMMETKHKFKCKDEVIYQNKINFGDEVLVWNYGIVNYENEDYVYLVGGLYINKKLFKVLPYEGNEYLVGTTDSPDEEVELMEGEWVMVSNKIEAQQDEWLLRYFLWIDEDKLCIQSVRFAYPDPCPYNYAIKFSDFNPNDMEETRKHILCVKDGKIIRYKERKITQKDIENAIYLSEQYQKGVEK